MEDKKRFEIAGAEPDRAQVVGNLKYDFTPPKEIAAHIAAFLNRVQPKEIFIAASTMADDIDEDDAVIAAIPERPGLLTIIAPRKPERFDAVAEKLSRSGVRFVRRTAPGGLELPGVLLLDSIGELAAVFRCADVVFMGGTLANRGGHNILEPAYFGKPVIIGPHMENFAAIAEEFRDATVRIGSARELREAITKLLDDPEARTAIGECARQIAESKRGVAAKLIEEIERAYALGIPNPLRTLPARIVLTPLSWLWILGGRIKAMGSAKSLQAPVVSVGGLSMGGAGKSPLVAHLAGRLREKGKEVAILTRGYRRDSSKDVIVPRGGSADVRDTGDEAQMFVRAGDAQVGIGADRYEVGRKMKADVFLLDDGFQHRKLARTHDIVVIDAMDPLAGGVFPLGRLREPFSAIARADTIVIARAVNRTGGLERLIAKHNPHAAVFRSRVIARHWVDSATGETVTPPFGESAAFCGLGSPASFWATLKELGIETAERRAFPDHRKYRDEDLAGFAAPVLLTTEKDAMNLPPRVSKRVYWLKIGIEIEREEEFLSRIL